MSARTTARHAAGIDLIVPVIFFLGACFVWLTTVLSHQTTIDVMRLGVLEQQANTDPLTKLANRRALEALWPSLTLVVDVREGRLEVSPLANSASAAGGVDFDFRGGSPSEAPHADGSRAGDRVAAVILLVGSVSFLGFGIQAPFPTWGQMLGTDGRLYAQDSATHLMWFPGAAIFISVYGFNMLGDALRDTLDPRLRGA